RILEDPMLMKYRTDKRYLPELHRSFSWARAEELDQDDQILLETPGIMEALAKEDKGDVPDDVIDMIRYVENVTKDLGDAQVVLTLTGLYDGHRTHSVTMAS